MITECRIEFVETTEGKNICCKCILLPVHNCGEVSEILIPGGCGISKHGYFTTKKAWHLCNTRNIKVGDTVKHVGCTTEYQVKYIFKDGFTMLVYKEGAKSESVASLSSFEVLK